MKKKFVFYELNEIPPYIFEYAAKTFPQSAFSEVASNGCLIETRAKDEGILSPWITWPTLHRGVSNTLHGISDINQNLEKINSKFPPVWEVLKDNDVSVGVFGCLHSYKKVIDERYSFFVPDTFAPEPDALPANLEVFQRFNVDMTGASARNVRRGIQLRSAFKFLSLAPFLGFGVSSAYRVLRQLISERVNRDRLVRRRSIQAEISFDLFLHQLRKTTPDVSFFFTNHLASSMHRYWPASFPKHYPDNQFAEDWKQRWKGEIPYACEVADRHLQQLIKFCKTERAKLIIVSSMGQRAVEDSRPIQSQVLITDASALLAYAGVDHGDWEQKLAMAPRVVIEPKSDEVRDKLRAINHLLVGGKAIEVSFLEGGDVSLKLELYNTSRPEIYDRKSGCNLDFHQLGLSVVELQDESGSYAYHDSQGVITIYDPCRPTKGPESWREVSVLDVAPSLIRAFDIPIPDHMKGESELFL